MTKRTILKLFLVASTKASESQTFGKLKLNCLFSRTKNTAERSKMIFYLFFLVGDLSPLCLPVSTHWGCSCGGIARLFYSVSGQKLVKYSPPLPPPPSTHTHSHTHTCTKGRRVHLMISGFSVTILSVNSGEQLLWKPIKQIACCIQVKRRVHTHTHTHTHTVVACTHTWNWKENQRAFYCSYIVYFLPLIQEPTKTKDSKETKYFNATWLSANISLPCIYGLSSFLLYVSLSQGRKEPNFMGFSCREHGEKKFRFHLLRAEDREMVGTCTHIWGYVLV